MAVTVENTGRGGLRIGSPRKLFETRIGTPMITSGSFMYSPHPDGQRFLVNARLEEEAPTVNIITNWQRAAAVTPLP
jgi:hypothetical protein